MRWVRGTWIEEGEPLFVVICNTQAGYEQVKSREAEACKHLTCVIYAFIKQHLVLKCTQMHTKIAYAPEAFIYSHHEFQINQHTGELYRQQKQVCFPFRHRVNGVVKFYGNHKKLTICIGGSLLYDHIS